MNGYLFMIYRVERNFQVIVKYNWSKLSGLSSQEYIEERRWSSSTMSTSSLDPETWWWQLPGLNWSRVHCSWDCSVMWAAATPAGIQSRWSSLMRTVRWCLQQSVKLPIDQGSPSFKVKQRQIKLFKVLIIFTLKILRKLMFWSQDLDSSLETKTQEAFPIIK